MQCLPSSLMEKVQAEKFEILLFINTYKANATAGILIGMYPRTKALFFSTTLFMIKNEIKHSRSNGIICIDHKERHIFKKLPDTGRFEVVLLISSVGSLKVCVYDLIYFSLN